MLRIHGAFLVFALACRSSSGEGTDATARKFEEMQQMVTGMLQKQDMVLEKLGAEAEADRSNAEIHAKRMEHAKQLHTHIVALKAGLDALGHRGEPMFDYSRFIDAGKHMEGVAQGVEESMQKIITMLPTVEEKAVQYQDMNFQYERGIKKMEDQGLPRAAKGVQGDVKAQVKKLEQVDFRSAYSPDMQKLAEKNDKTKDGYVMMIERQKFPLKKGWTTGGFQGNLKEGLLQPDVDFGVSPYDKLSFRSYSGVSDRKDGDSTEGGNNTPGVVISYPQPRPDGT